ncbi:MAG: tetratricopeptide repeat protein [Colwellia sp.]|nr:tetratricopeptide repeat protein [Colwellia sp.]
MLFHQYINQNKNPTSAKLLRAIFSNCCLFFLLFLVSCTSVNEKAENSQNVKNNKKITNKERNDDIKIISNELIALVESTPENGTQTRELNKLDEIGVVLKKNNNLYLEQISTLTINVPEKTNKNYQQALIAMKNKDWQSANHLFDQVIVAEPKLSGSYVNKSIIAMAQNKMIIAQFNIERAIRANPLNPYAYNLQGQLSRLKGDFILSEKSYLKALSIWPDYPEVHWNYAVLLELYRGRYFDAKTYYLSYQKLLPDDKLVKRSIAGLEIKIARAEN